MGADSRRVVLGFYASEEEYAQQAWRAVRPVATHAHYYRSDGTSESSTQLSEKYASLRLKDEELVVAEVDSAKVPGVVGSLRSAGEPAVFVLRLDEPLPAGQHAPTIIYSWRGILD